MMTESNVSAEVLNDLKTIINGRGIKNIGFETSTNTNPGDNNSGVITSVRVEGVDEREQTIVLHLVVKTMHNINDVNYRNLIRSVFQREIYMYNTFFPEVLKFQQEKNVARLFSSFPECYFTCLNNFKEAVVMKDLKADGYKLANRRFPLDFDHVLLVLKEQGRLHAVSFAMRHQKPDLFRSLCRNTQDLFVAVLKYYPKMFGMLLRIALANFDPHHDKIAYECLDNYRKTFEERLEEVLKEETAGKYAVVCHGDSWISNLLFKYDDTDKPHTPTDVCFLDFQISRCGSPALDISQFIFTCTDKALRDKHYKTLISEYYKSLSSHLRELGSDPEELFPWEVLQNHLKKFSVYGFHMGVSFMYTLTCEADEMPSFLDEGNYETLLKLVNEDSRVKETNHRLRDVVLDFIRYGYDF